MSAREPKPVAIITARGGPKGLPRKNLLDLAGRPLICHTIAAALGCKSVHGVYVSTEDAEIAAVATTAGAVVIERPKALARDDSSSREVCLHALDWLETRGEGAESFVLLQPTSPLRTSDHIARCISDFELRSYGCAISVCEAEHHPARFLKIGGDGLLSPWSSRELLNVPRQSLPKVYRQNGAIYLIRTRDFRDRAEGFFLAPAMPFVMRPEDSIDIDTALDFELARTVMEARR